jgi:outer membrane receptor protein involved in Fe transport
MYGRGYRPPLSFFESQHGLSENGFEVQIDDVETSHSLGYSLAYTVPGLSVTASSHRTWLTNMAYADGDVAVGAEAIFKNAHAEYKIWANDVVLSWDVFANWNVQLSYENFSLQDDYKFRLPAAAIEQRARLASDWHFGNWEFVNTFTWVGARDLSRYNYGQHYRTFKDVADGLGGFIQEVDQRKNLAAPSFVTWDVYLGWKWKKEVSFFASVQNLLDFTQASYGDSPLNWASHGGDASHFHLDNNHTWGPLRGRLFSVGLKAEL